MDVKEGFKRFLALLFVIGPLYGFLIYEKWPQLLSRNIWDWLIGACAAVAVTGAVFLVLYGATGVSALGVLRERRRVSNGAELDD